MKILLSTYALALSLCCIQSIAQQHPQSNNDDLIALAEQVHTGHLPCDVGQSVTITAEKPSGVNFFIEHKNKRYRVTPVYTSTGAIRLEDDLGVIIWIQLPNKSMLMNSKLGQRVADGCQSPAQMKVSEAMKLAPPVNILEPLVSAQVRH